MDESFEYPTEVVSDDERVHRLRLKPLGVGGQGIVFRTGDRDTAVKLIATMGVPLRVADSAQREQLYRQLVNVRMLPLPDPDDLHLAVPVAFLVEPYVGYVMRLLDGMVPIGSLLAPKDENIAEYYVKGGGLRRRLALLAKAATILARLHGVPVVYADISPNNVFVSETTNAEEVWLIDADNLHFLSGRGHAIYTPGFGAPEVIRGESGVNTLTDIHAFAVLAFLILTQHHPFIGNYVEDGDGGWDSDEDEDREAAAYAGKVAWIHDKQDDANRSSHGIPREWVLSPGLWQLFHATFGAGRTNPLARPSITHWVEALLRAADMTIGCPSCRWSYYGNRPSCPHCGGSPPNVVKVDVRHWNPELDEDEFDPAEGRKVHREMISPGSEPRPIGKEASRPIWHMIMTVGREEANHEVIRRHVVRPTLFRDGDPEAIAVKLGRNTITFRPVDGGEYHLVRSASRQSEWLERGRDASIPLAELNDQWILHCGPLDRPHRLLTFGYFPGVR